MTTQVCSLWCDVDDVRALPEADDALTDPVITTSIEISSDVLYNLSGRQWPGECHDLIRPCSQYKVFDAGPPSRAGLLGARWWPQVVGGRARGWGFCSCNRDDSCGCVSLPALTLTGKRILSIVHVKLDGEVLDESEYRVDDGRQLVRLPKPDGSRPGWPCCQRLDLTDDEVGTMSVEFIYGGMPPSGGVASAALLACQFALAMTPALASKCRLPKRVTTITRQGTTIAVLDPLTLFRDGLTGIPEVDLWLASLRLGASRRPALFANPESVVRPTRRRTG